jgi:sodium/hydrogen antiporter
MTIMWLSTSACIFATIKQISVLATFIIGACVTSTDPILSQAIAKGPFADQYVPRPLREIISAEAGANDGFASPFLMLAVDLMISMQPGADGVGGGIRDWVIGTLLYIVLLAVAYGAVVGCCARVAVSFALKRGWIDSESYLLFPTALGVSERLTFLHLSGRLAELRTASYRRDLWCNLDE